MAVRFRGGANQFRRWAQARMDEFNEQVIIDIEDALEDAANVMRENIATRATTWMRENKGKIGRIDTGHMLDAVGWDLSKGGEDVFQGRFGWVKDAQQYYRVQEYGTAGTGVKPYDRPNARDIEPMLAYTDAKAYFNQRMAEIRAKYRKR